MVFAVSRWLLGAHIIQLGFFFGAFVIEEKRTSFQVNPYNARYRIGTKTSLHLDT